MKVTGYCALSIVSAFLCAELRQGANALCAPQRNPPAPGFADGPQAVPGFCLEGPIAGFATAAFQRPPSANSPFVHFDLREFTDCKVPYSFFDGTADPGTPGLREFDEVDAAFATWEQQTPAVIGFSRKLPATGRMCPFHLDSHNMIGWSGINCQGPGDDVCLVAGGCACGGAVAPGGG